VTSSARRFSLTKPDGTLKTADELQAEADEMVRNAQQRAQQLQAAIADNVVEATSKDQAATVTVTAAGALRSVRLNDRIKSMGPAKVSTSIMEAYQAAARQAAARTVEIAQQHSGDERVVRMMRDLMPDLPDEEESRRW